MSSSWKSGFFGVIIAGRWNRAILTPQGIGHRLLKLDADTQMSVEVPIDSIGPYKVRHSDLAILADWNRLRVESEKKDYPGLKKCMEIGLIAIEGLPETPIEGVGINTNFVSEVRDERIEQLNGSDFDFELGKVDLNIKTRTLTRTVEWNGGVINIKVESDDKQSRINFNFEKRSGVPSEIKNWLTLPISEIEKVTKDVFQSLGCEPPGLSAAT